MGKGRLTLILSLAALAAFSAAPTQASSQSSAVRYWLCQSFGNRGFLFSTYGARPTVADELVSLGPPAIPDLIEALEDTTPIRGFVDMTPFGPMPRPGPPPPVRHQDIAIRCLEHIVGCRFYEESNTGVWFSCDTPEGRASAIANVKEWWRVSQGASQAQMIRNQLALMEGNTTLYGYHRLYALETLAMLEGPEGLIEETRGMLASDSRPDSPLREVLDRVEPRLGIRDAFERFRADDPHDNGSSYVLKYGDRATYQEVARRFAATGRLGQWLLSDLLRRAAQYGQNWAIPILAEALTQNEMSGSRYVAGQVGSEPFGPADVAAELFQNLTGEDFGYRRGTSVEERLAAIARAREWWLNGGQQSLAEVIAKDHPPVAVIGDLFLSDEEIEARAEAIESDNAAVRRKAVAAVTVAFSSRIQRALLNALKKEKDPQVRVRILQGIQGHPALWHLPALAEVMANDQGLGARLLAGTIITSVVRDKTTSMWWYRLETRETALQAARRLVRDDDAPLPLRQVALGILDAWDATEDQPVLYKMAVDPAFRDSPAIRSYLQRRDFLGLSPP